MKASFFVRGRSIKMDKEDVKFDKYLVILRRPIPPSYPLPPPPLLPGGPAPITKTSLDNVKELYLKKKKLNGALQHP